MAKFSGINIQFPISELILSGEKSIETRTYLLPEELIDVDLLFIETPGAEGAFKARIRAIIRFGESFKYKNSSEFYKDFQSHRVSPDSPWRWVASKKKYGWPIISCNVLKKPLEITQRRGIIYTHNIEISPKRLSFL